MALGSVVAYIVGEGLVDAASAANTLPDETIQTPTETITVPATAGVAAQATAVKQATAVGPAENGAGASGGEGAV